VPRVGAKGLVGQHFGEVGEERRGEDCVVYHFRSKTQTGSGRERWRSPAYDTSIQNIREAGEMSAGSTAGRLENRKNPSGSRMRSCRGKDRQGVEPVICDRCGDVRG
jgi:hypothetical protein